MKTKIKKLLCPAVCTAMLLSALSGCGAEKIKKISVPDEIKIDDAALQSGELQTDAEKYYTQDFPLVAEIPEKDIHVYDVNQDESRGVLIKYGKKVCYYNWTYNRITSSPEIFVSDYDGDGEEELAVSLVINEGILGHEENLYIVEINHPDMGYIPCFGETIYTNAKSLVSISDTEKENVYALSDGRSTITLDYSSEKSELESLYCVGDCNFILGESIVGKVALRAQFASEEQPKSTDCSFVANVVYDGSSCGISDFYVAEDVKLY